MKREDQVTAYAFDLSAFMKPVDIVKVQTGSVALCLSISLDPNYRGSSRFSKHLVIPGSYLSIPELAEGSSTSRSKAMLKITLHRHSYGLSIWHPIVFVRETGPGQQRQQSHAVITVLVKLRLP